MRIWDAATGQLVRQLQLSAGSGPVRSIAFSPDDKHLAAGAQNTGQIEVWDVASGQRLATLTGHAAGVEALQFTPDGTRLASGSFDQTVRIWDADTYDSLLTLRDHEEPVTSLVFSHYDRSNDFYELFLGERMVYSCAYFNRPDASLDQAQAAKLDHICRKLHLQSGDRYLDIGCGWGALVLEAAQQWGVSANGCTLSRRQFEYASQRVRAARLEHQASIQEMDYRDFAGEFDKISSVGMFEQVGRAHLESYFRKVYALLAPNGLFLNHGITRPAPMRSDTQSLFIARNVFPGGQIVNLHDVIRAAERAGFEVLDVENLRRHYAHTCRAWVDRLTANRELCLEKVDPFTWRTWLLYLAGSAVAFEAGGLGLHQVLLAKRGANTAAPATRDYMYCSI